MIIYSPSVGSGFEKCWCWEKMALCCLKGKPQGGQMLWYSSRSVAAGPHGCSLPSRGKIVWVTPTLLSGRSRGKWQAVSSGMPLGSRCWIYQWEQNGKNWSQPVLHNSDNVREDVCVAQYFQMYNKRKWFLAFDPSKRQKVISFIRGQLDLRRHEEAEWKLKPIN